MSLCREVKKKKRKTSNPFIHFSKHYRQRFVKTLKEAMDSMVSGILCHTCCYIQTLCLQDVIQPGKVYIVVSLMDTDVYMRVSLSICCVPPESESDDRAEVGCRGLE